MKPRSCHDVATPRRMKIIAGCHGLAAQRSGHAVSSRLEPQAFRTTPITPLRFVLGRATRVYFHRRLGETHGASAWAWAAAPASGSSNCASPPGSVVDLQPPRPNTTMARPNDDCPTLLPVPCPPTPAAAHGIPHSTLITTGTGFEGRAYRLVTFLYSCWRGPP